MHQTKNKGNNNKFGYPRTLLTQIPVINNLSKDKSGLHPTQKPRDLYRWLLMNYAESGNKIIDTHLGSGSIACACDELKFNLTACEIELRQADQHT